MKSRIPRCFPTRTLSRTRLRSIRAAICILSARVSTAVWSSSRTRAISSGILPWTSRKLIFRKPCSAWSFQGNSLRTCSMSYRQHSPMSSLIIRGLSTPQQWGIFATPWKSITLPAAICLRKRCLASARISRIFMWTGRGLSIPAPRPVWWMSIRRAASWFSPSVQTRAIWMWQVFILPCRPWRWIWKAMCGRRMAIRVIWSRFGRPITRWWSMRRWHSTSRVCMRNRWTNGTRCCA